MINPTSKRVNPSRTAKSQLPKFDQHQDREIIMPVLWPLDVWLGDLDTHQAFSFVEFNVNAALLNNISDAYNPLTEYQTPVTTFLSPCQSHQERLEQSSIAAYGASTFSAKTTLNAPPKPNEAGVPDLVFLPQAFEPETPYPEEMQAIEQLPITQIILNGLFAAGVAVTASAVSPSDSSSIPTVNTPKTLPTQTDVQTPDDEIVTTLDNASRIETEIEPKTELQLKSKTSNVEGGSANHDGSGDVDDQNIIVNVNDQALTQLTPIHYINISATNEHIIVATTNIVI